MQFARYVDLNPLLLDEPEQPISRSRANRVETRWFPPCSHVAPLEALLTSMLNRLLTGNAPSGKDTMVSAAYTAILSG